MLTGRTPIAPAPSRPVGMDGTDAYQQTFELLSLGNAKEMTRRLTECCVLDEMGSGGV